MRDWFDAIDLPAKILACLVALGGILALIPKLFRLMMAFYDGAKFTLDIRDHMTEMKKEVVSRHGEIILAIKRIDEGQRNIIVTHQQMLDCSHMPWFITDGHGRYQWVNTRWKRLTGLETEQIRGHGWENGIHPDDRPRVILSWNTAVDHQRDHEENYRFINRAGVSSLPIRMVAHPIRNEAGTILNYIGHSLVDGMEELAAATPR